MGENTEFNKIIDAIYDPHFTENSFSQKITLSEAMKTMKEYNNFRKKEEEILNKKKKIAEMLGKELSDME
jgi:hypothetical protein